MLVGLSRPTRHCVRGRIHQAFGPWSTQPASASARHISCACHRHRTGLSGLSRVCALVRPYSSVSQTVAPAASILYSDAVSHLRDSRTAREVYIIGTVHSSKASAEMVRALIREVRPQVVMLEVSEREAGRLVQGEQRVKVFRPLETTKMEPLDLEDTKPFAHENENEAQSRGAMEKAERALLGMLQSLQGSITTPILLFRLRKLNDHLLPDNEQDMAVASEEARAVGADVVLMDLDGPEDVSLAMGAWQKAKHMRRSSDAPKRPNVLDLNPLTDDVLGFMVQELERVPSYAVLPARAAVHATMLEELEQRVEVEEDMEWEKVARPALYKAHVQQRDEHMANALHCTQGRVTVGVVGFTHLPGIEAMLVRCGWTIIPHVQSLYTQCQHSLDSAEGLP